MCGEWSLWMKNALINLDKPMTYSAYFPDFTHIFILMIHKCPITPHEF